MMFSVCLRRGLVLLLLALALAGCLPPAQSQLEEEKEPYFLAGQSRVRIMDYAGAVECFEKALRADPKSASAHLELGWLFDQKRGDPVAAIYHYRRYLRLCPQSNKADTVNQRILACEQELASTVSLGPVSQKLERGLEKLTEENKRLLDANQKLNAEVASWRAYYAAHPAALNVSSPPTTPVVVAAAAIGAALQPGPRPQGRPALPASLLPGPNNPAPTTVANPPRLPSPPPLGAPAPALSTDPVSSAAAGSGGIRPAAVARTHIVRERETLAIIARHYGVKVAALMAANPGLEPRRLRPGQTLNLPPP